ncbi:hypothetical protein BJX70DRAFT_10602 [Aspergillus crustosus]
MSSKRQSAPQSFVEAKSCTRKRWTDEERKSLWDQRLLYSDLTWPEFYKLGLFPDRTEKALRLEFAENQEKKKLVSSQPTNNIPVSSTSAKPRSSPASKVTASMTTTSSPKPIAFCGCKRHRAEGDDGKDSNRRHEKVQRTEQPGATTRNQPGSERPPETVQNAAPLTPTPANAIGQRQALTRVSQAQIINLDEVASPADKVSTMAGPATVTSTPSRNAIVSESSISEVKAEPVPHEDQRTGTSTPMAPNSTRAHLVRTPASADKPQGTAPAKARLVSQLHASKPPAAERVVATPVNDKGPATPLSNGPNLARQAQPSQTTTSTSQAQRPPMAALAICKSNDQPQANQGLTQNRPGSPPDRMQSTSTSTPANTNPIGPWQPSQRASLDKPAVVPSAAQKASISTPIKPSRATQPPVSNNISQNEDAVARPEQLSKQSTSGGATGQTQSTISAAPERPSPATNSHRNIGHSITPRAQTPVTHSQPTMDTQPLSQLAGAVPREQSSQQQQHPSQLEPQSSGPRNHICRPIPQRTSRLDRTRLQNKLHLHRGHDQRRKSSQSAPVRRSDIAVASSGLHTRRRGTRRTRPHRCIKPDAV